MMMPNGRNGPQIVLPINSPVPTTSNISTMAELERKLLQVIETKFASIKPSGDSNIDIGALSKKIKSELKDETAEVCRDCVKPELLAQHKREINNLIEAKYRELLAELTRQIEAKGKSLDALIATQNDEIKQINALISATRADFGDYVKRDDSELVTFRTQLAGLKTISATIATLNNRISSLDQQKPTASGEDLGKINAQLSKLESSIGQLETFKNTAIPFITAKLDRLHNALPDGVIGNINRIIAAFPTMTEATIKQSIEQIDSRLVAFQNTIAAVQRTQDIQTQLTELEGKLNTAYRSDIAALEARMTQLHSSFIRQETYTAEIQRLEQLIDGAKATPSSASSQPIDALRAELSNYVKKAELDNDINRLIENNPTLQQRLEALGNQITASSSATEIAALRAELEAIKRDHVKISTYDSKIAELDAAIKASSSSTEIAGLKEQLKNVVKKDELTQQLQEFQELKGLRADIASQIKALEDRLEAASSTKEIQRIDKEIQSLTAQIDRKRDIDMAGKAQLDANLGDLRNQIEQVRGLVNGLNIDTINQRITALETELAAAKKPEEIAALRAEIGQLRDLIATNNTKFEREISELKTNVLSPEFRASIQKVIDAFPTMNEDEIRRSLENINADITQVKAFDSRISSLEDKIKTQLSPEELATLKAELADIKTKMPRISKENLTDLFKRVAVLDKLIPQVDKLIPQVEDLNKLADTIQDKELEENADMLGEIESILADIKILKAEFEELDVYTSTEVIDEAIDNFNTRLKRFKKQGAAVTGFNPEIIELKKQVLKTHKQYSREVSELRLKLLQEVNRRLKEIDTPEMKELIKKIKGADNLRLGKLQTLLERTESAAASVPSLVPVASSTSATPAIRAESAPTETQVLSEPTVVPTLAESEPTAVQTPIVPAPTVSDTAQKLAELNKIRASDKERLEKISAKIQLMNQLYTELSQKNLDDTEIENVRQFIQEKKLTKASNSKIDKNTAYKKLDELKQGVIDSISSRKKKAREAIDVVNALNIQSITNDIEEINNNAERNIDSINLDDIKNKEKLKAAEKTVSEEDYSLKRENNELNGTIQRLPQRIERFRINYVDKLDNKYMIGGNNTLTDTVDLINYNYNLSETSED